MREGIARESEREIARERESASERERKRETETGTETETETETDEGSVSVATTYRFDKSRACIRMSSNMHSHEAARRDCDWCFYS